MVCPMRYVLFAVSLAIFALVYYSDSTTETGVENLSWWETTRDFLTGRYLWEKYKSWKANANAAAPEADMAESKDTTRVRNENEE
ncbi:hypothetical protein AAMO2058_001308600 [Amorphochlora amoebiformis]